MFYESNSNISNPKIFQTAYTDLKEI